MGYLPASQLQKRRGRSLWKPFVGREEDMDGVQPNCGAAKQRYNAYLALRATRGAFFFLSR